MKNKDLSAVAKHLLERRSASNILAQGSLIAEVGHEGVQEALNRRWIEPEPESGYLSISNALVTIKEMEEAALNDEDLEDAVSIQDAGLGLGERVYAYHDVLGEHMNQKSGETLTFTERPAVELNESEETENLKKKVSDRRVTETNAPGMGGMLNTSPASSASTRLQPDSNPNTAQEVRKKNQQSSDLNHPDQEHSVGDEVSVVGDDGQVYTGRVQSLNGDKYTVAFAGRRPQSNHDYMANEITAAQPQV